MRDAMKQQMEDAEIRKASCRIAVKCRHVVQGCLLDSEIHDADTEFSRIAEEVIRELLRTR